ncbi:nuclease-related domain-containing protein [uncultured Fibrobacter sp.]|uniref:nuclease-related domain-containing protein n=1 Tax=uncultured Fibrobacter sp. TaxID=261512 RepID=UPI00262E4AB5|nr:nuclease-related domain-containing protein [uncultured Fibrobacter sp.]
MGTIFGIALIIAFIFAAIDGATKPRRRRRRRSRRNDDNNSCVGCLTVMAILICLWLGSIAVNFIKAHSTAFIVGGIVLVLIIVVAAIVFNATQTEEFPEDVEPTYPKISEPPKFTHKAQSFSSSSSKQEPSPFTKEQLSVHPATYEDVVGTIPTAAEMVGKLGEDAVSRAVWAACQFDKRHYKILRNVYVPTIDGYSEIDVLLLHETGIYVFESKNLSGSVYGDEKHPQWQRYKTNGEKSPIPNPILQNKRHIDCLCVFLNQNKYQFRAFSMIVFGNKSKLKYIPENKSLTSIHEICNLEIELLKKMQAEQIFYSVETIDEWCKKLLPCTMLSEEEKQAHKDRITKKFKQNLRH